MPGRSSRIAYCLAQAALLLGAIVALHPVILDHFSTHYLGGAVGDGGLYVWLSSSFCLNPVQALSLETGALYPYPLTRAWSDSFLIPSAASCALSSIGLPPAAAYNSIVLLALVLNGLAAQSLARAIGLDSLSALVSGVLLSTSSYLMGNIGHPQLMYLFLPIFSWALVIGGAASPRRWLAAGVLTAAAFYCAVYYAVFAALGLGILLLMQTLSGTLRLGPAAFRAFSLAGGALPILIALPSYLKVQAAFGERHLYEASAFSASGLSYLAFSPFNRLFGVTSAATHLEATLCAGYLVTCVAVTATFARTGSRSPLSAVLLAVALLATLIASSMSGYGPVPHVIAGVGAWALLAAALALPILSGSAAASLWGLVLVFLVLSLGPGGAEVRGEPMLAPLRALFGVVPGLDAIRAVGRYGAVVVAGTYIAAAAALASIRRPFLRAIAAALLVAVTITENYISEFPLDPAPPAPLAFERLAEKISSGESAVALPFAGRNDRGEISWGRLAVLNTAYAIWAAPLGIPVANGYSGQRSRLQHDLSEALLEFPSERALDQLGRVCGLRWVIIVPSLIPGWNRSSFTADVSRLSGRINVAEELSDGSILVDTVPQVVVAHGSSATILAKHGLNSTLTARAISGSPCELSVTPVLSGPAAPPGAAVRVSLAGNEPSSLSLSALALRGSAPAAPVAFQVTAPQGCSAAVSCSAR